MSRCFFAICMLWLTVISTQNVQAAHPIAGATSAKVQVLVYGDLQCPFTAIFMSYISRLQTDYGDQIGVQFAHFPLYFHSEAKPAAIAANCAGNQGQFASFIERMWSHRDQLGHEYYLKVAAEIGVADLQKFGACLSDPASQAIVENEYAAGIAVGVDSTPDIFINGTLVKGAYEYDTFKEHIDKALQK